MKGSWIAIGVVVVISMLVIILLFVPIESHAQTYVITCEQAGQIVQYLNFTLPTATVSIQWDSSASVWLVVGQGQNLAWENGPAEVTVTSGSGTFPAHSGAYSVACLTQAGSGVTVSILLQYSTPLV